MKRSLEERLAPFVAEKDMEDLGRESLDCVFLGVSLLTGMRHPRQRLRQIKDAYQMPDDMLYFKTMRFAKRMIDSEDRRQEGIELMCQLLIEPFAAIHEIQKEDGPYDRT